MTATNETYLPTYEELYVPPLNITSAALKAGALYFGQYCDFQSKEYMLCKAEEKDPRKCLKYNKEVSRCANDFFHKVRDNCAETFTNYWKCLDRSSDGQMSYKSCRKTQLEFDKCMQEKLNINRPEVGVMSKVRLHNSDRPKPVEKPKDYQTLPEAPLSTKAHPEVEETIRKTAGGRLF